ncbi:hypothetical protein Tco_0794448 [Tanacetum coccineum]
MSLANQKATTEYQEAIQATEDLESPAVGFAKTSDYKGGLAVQIFSGKLKTRWSGPFTITKVFPYGTIELSQPDGPNFKVNGHRVKHYFRGDLPPKAELLALREQQRRARQPGPDVRVPDHQDASRDADSHI